MCTLLPTRLACLIPKTLFPWNIKGIVGVYNVTCTQFGLAHYYRYYMSVCPLTTRPFMDLWAPNLAGRSGMVTEIGCLRTDHVQTHHTIR